MTELISVLITTYDRPDALDAVLRGLSDQTDRNFEVIVADDGSPPTTAAVVDAWRHRVGVPLAHVWQEHDGFRAPEISNKAIAKSRGTYCVFLDGDCIPRPNFIARHRSLAEPGWFVFGNRVLMSRELSTAVLLDQADPEAWPLSRFVGLRARGEVNRVTPLLTLPLGPLRKRGSHNWHSVRTCNLAIWRADLDRVDGQEELYRGWGPHDSDLAIRLLRSGVSRKDGRFATGVLHLWHKDADRSGLEANQALLDDLLKSDRVRALRGLSTLPMQPAASDRPHERA